MFIEALICIIISMVSTECFLIATTTGLVRGKLNNDYNLSYFSYQGIPYAENPTGELRFKAPIPKKPWTNILDATKPGPVCPQPEGNYNRLQMSEDCLVLNIYVPANTTGKLLPVFAFVHGGGYKMLSGDNDILYGPQFYLKRDLIFVSMNYRLGALGFLSLENDQFPGNAGLKDILLALKWIKVNIDRFGGDNSMITLGGSSSGSSMSHYLMLTNKAKGLFNRAFLASGSAISFRFVQKKPRDNALALADKLGLTIEDSENFTQTISKIDVSDIVDAQENIFKDNRSEMRPFGPFVPSVEPVLPEAVITKHPLDILRFGTPNPVPVLVGFNSLEGVYYWATLKKNETLVKNLPKLFPECIPPDLECPKKSEYYQKLVDYISDFYFGGTDLNNFTRHNFLELLSDTQYTYNVDHWVKIYKDQNPNNVLYYYLFDFDGDLNWAKLNYHVTEVAGTAHSDDLGYQFITRTTKPLLNDIDSRSRRMMDLMMTLFTNFMKYGNPTPDCYEGTKWPQYNTQGKYMVLSDEPRVEERGPNANRMEFWRNVYQEFQEVCVNLGGPVKDNNLI